MNVKQISASVFYLNTSQLALHNGAAPHAAGAYGGLISTDVPSS